MSAPVPDRTKLNLTPNELRYIDDKITLRLDPVYRYGSTVDTKDEIPTLRGLGASAELAVPVSFIRNIGYALIDAIETEGAVDVWFDMDDLYLLREIANTPARIGNENIGDTLRFKVWKGLQKLDNCAIMEETGLSFGLVDEPNKADIKEQLEAHNADESTDENTDQDDTGDRPGAGETV